MAAKTARACCPTCGRAYAKPKAAPDRTSIDPTSIAEVYAHYKRTAPVEDVRFALRVGVVMSPELAIDWAVLLADVEAGRVQRAEGYRRLYRLQERWRRDRLYAERAERASMIEQARRWAQTLTIGLSLEAWEYNQAVQAGTVPRAPRVRRVS